MRIALYVRVSTSHQVLLQTIEQQLEQLRRYIEAQGWQVGDENVFRDDGYSGATLKRPGLDRLRDKVRRHEVDRLLVTSPDRLARNYVQQMVLLEEMAQHGCEVEFLDQPLSQDPHDQLLLQIRGAVAEYERTLISERMRRGRQAKLRAGLLLPWSHAPYGLRLDLDHPRDPTRVSWDAVEAAVVVDIFASYLAANGSLSAVSKQLERRGIRSPTGRTCWSSMTLRGILTNPVYTGKIYADRTTYRPPRTRRSATHPIGRPHGTAVATPPEMWILVATIPELVSQEQFDMVQAKLAQNKAWARRNNSVHHYLLRALVSCGTCHLACFARTLNRRYQYYLCSAKSNSRHGTHPAKCPSRYVPATQLDELVWHDLCELITHPDLIRDALERAQGSAWLPQETQARLENVHSARRSLHQQLERLTDAYLQDVIPLAEYERRRRELEAKDEALHEQARDIEGQSHRQLEAAELATSIQAFCQRVQTGLASATFEQKRELVMLLVDRVIVTDGEVEIRYVIPTSPASEQVRFCQLRKDYFYHPAAWQHDQAFLILGPQDDA